MMVLQDTLRHNGSIYVANMILPLQWCIVQHPRACCSTCCNNHIDRAACTAWHMCRNMHRNTQPQRDITCWDTCTGDEASWQHKLKSTIVHYSLMLKWLTCKVLLRTVAIKGNHTDVPYMQAHTSKARWRVQFSSCPYTETTRETVKPYLSHIMLEGKDHIIVNIIRSHAACAKPLKVTQCTLKWHCWVCWASIASGDTAK